VNRLRSRAAGTLVAALAALLAAAAPAGANFKVSPTVIDLHRSAGEASVGSFDVDLKKESSHRFQVAVEDLVQQPDGTFAYLPPSNSPYSASNWVAVTPRTFEGGPDRSQPIQYTVRVPEGAEPGDHFTSLTVKRLPSRRDVTAAPVQAISVRLTIRVAGQAKPGARIASLDVPKVVGESPVNVTAEIVNTGNVRLDFDRRNKGSLAVVSGSDEQARQEFTGVLYPGQTRLFELAWDNPPLFGRNDAEASVDVGPRDVRDSESFFVAPWRQIGALVLIGLAALVLGLGIRRRRYG
jgi:hypothetical protein